MRIYILAILMLLEFHGYSQQCNCEQIPELKDLISCSPVLFKNHTKLYRQYNCDSSWLVFKNGKGKNIVLYSLEAGLMDLTERLGYTFATEYKSSFLIKNHLISGCCTPPEYILNNKTTGQKKITLGRLIFYSENINQPIVAYFEDNQYNANTGNKNLLNSIVVKNIESGKTQKKLLPTGRIMTTLQASSIMYAEQLIEIAVIEVDYLKITYQHKSNENEDWQSETIKFNLQKLSH